MDKTWMSKDRMSKEYEDGVEQFIAFAVSHASNPKLMKCPCQICENLMFETPKGVRDHMFIRCVYQSYKIWSWHGEVADIGGTTSREVNLDQSPKYEEVQETLQMVNAAYELLSSLGKMLPVNNDVPISMYEAKKTMIALGLEYKKIHEEGIEVYDSYKQQLFTLKAVSLWTINDFPAYGNLFGCVVKRYDACPICGEDAYSNWLTHGKKNVYTRHKRFLPRHHPYRKLKKVFGGRIRVEMKY
ncbi:PREDICTED: transposon [Prunus dulcis]|uniref:PREDICTED: transposon n=1 Tax=Prunus dulcis TaxID=3755 RepID=A0A5E4FQZ7_PRUDU|nr:hypothetical protein L3X38_025826 [Prunus dulcis]VVA29905.1 PREDICTED: transposon [Prunus dulcis]